MDPVAVHWEQAGGGGGRLHDCEYAYVCAHGHMHHFSMGLT